MKVHLKTLEHLGILSVHELQRLWEEYLSAKTDFPSFLHFLIHQGKLSQSQGHYVANLWKRGYQYCFSCHKVYSLHGKEEKDRCSHCQGELETFSLVSDETKTMATPSDSFPSKDSSPCSSPGKEPTLLVRKELSRYPIQKVLGKGGFGRVYQVKDTLTSRTMALKILHQSRDFALQKRFRREIQITANLEHPQIMPVYDSGYLQDGSLYFVMKEFQGGTLKELLTREKGKRGDSGQETSRNLREYLDIFLKIADALDYAHSKRVIHRDLKPSNIGVGDFGEVLVTDWGIAKRLDEDEVEEVHREADAKENQRIHKTDLTGRKVLGTPGYLSPEQASGKEVDQRSDVYGLGAILYEILAFVPPFQGSHSERLVAVLMKDPLPPEKVLPNSDIPPELSAIALKALERDPNERYQSVKELKRDVQLYLEGHSVSAKRDSLWQKGWKWMGRNKVLSAGIGAALFGILFSLFTVFQWQSFQRKEKKKAALSRSNQILDKSSVFTADELKEKFSKSYEVGQSEAPLARRAREKSLKTYLQARRELEKAWRLDQENLQIRNQLFGVEKEIGKLALLGGDFLISEAAFERCLELGRKKEARELLTSLKKHRAALLQFHFRRIEEIFSQLRSSPPYRGMLDEYVSELAAMKKRHASQKLLFYLDEGTYWQKMIAIEALGKLRHRSPKYKSRDVVQWLLKLLRDLNLEKREKMAKSIIWALGRLKDRRATAIVLQICQKKGFNSPFWQDVKVPFRWLPLPLRPSKTLDEKLERGRILFYQRNFSKALAVFNRILEKDEKEYRAYFWRGKTFMEKKEYDRALADFDRSLAINSSHWPSYLYKAMTYKKRTRLQNLTAALENVKKALEFNPHSAHSYLLEGKIYRNKGEIRRAIASLKKSLEYENYNQQAYLQLGFCYMHLQSYPRAGSMFTEALRIDPNYIRANIYMGVIHKKLKNYDRALAYYARAQSLNPQRAEVYLVRANLYMELKMWKKALEDYNLGLKLDKRDSIGYSNRGHLYYKMKKYEKALADIEKSLKLHDSQGGRLLKAYCLLAMKKFTEAIKEFDHLINQYPQQARYLLQRGQCYHRAGQNKKALKDFQKLLKKFPHSPLSKTAKSLIDKIKNPN